jgi:MFS family permease
MEPVIPLHLEDHLGASSTMIEVLFMGMWLGFGAASPLGGVLSDRWGSTRTMAIGLGLMALFVPALSMPDHMLLEAVVMVVVGIAFGVTLAPTLPELADAVDRLGGGSYASVYAIWNEFFAIGMAVGPLAGGRLRDTFSVRSTLAIASIPLTVYVLILPGAAMFRIPATWRPCRRIAQRGINLRAMKTEKMTEGSANSGGRRRGLVHRPASAHPPCRRDVGSGAPNPLLQPAHANPEGGGTTKFPAAPP